MRYINVYISYSIIYIKHYVKKTSQPVSGYSRIVVWPASPFAHTESSSFSLHVVVHYWLANDLKRKLLVLALALALPLTDLANENQAPELLMSAVSLSTAANVIRPRH